MTNLKISIGFIPKPTLKCPLSGPSGILYQLELQTEVPNKHHKSAQWSKQRIEPPLAIDRVTSLKFEQYRNSKTEV